MFGGDKVGTYVGNPRAELKRRKKKTSRYAQKAKARRLRLAEMKKNAKKTKGGDDVLSPTEA